jgi:hypothetical protein
LQKQSLLIQHQEQIQQVPQRKVRHRQLCGTDNQSINNDLCSVGSSGAAQTQILGLSFGTTSRDMNCERIKLAKNLYDMGMKVAGGFYIMSR